MKPLNISAAADADLIELFDQWLHHASHPTALDFQSRTDEALTHIARFPRTGSTRYAHLMPSSVAQSDLDGTGGQFNLFRSWIYNQFPLIVFYLERRDAIQIIRVLPQSVDIPNRLTP